MARFPEDWHGGPTVHIPIHPGTRYDQAKGAVTSPAMRSKLLSDEEVELLRSIDSDYSVAMHTDTSNVEIYNDADELVAVAPDIQKAIVIIKAIYAASRHAWTSKQLDRERRIAFRHGVTITPGTSLDEYELDFLPARSIVEVDGWVLQRTIGGWVTQRGNKATAPTYGVFMGIIDRYFEAPFEEYDDDDDDDDGYEPGCPYGFEDCCE